MSAGPLGGCTGREASAQACIFLVRHTHSTLCADWLDGALCMCVCVCVHSTLSPVPQLAVICMSVQAMAHKSRTTTAPLRRVNRVQFGVLGPEEIKGELVLAQTVLGWVLFLTSIEVISHVGCWVLGSLLNDRLFLDCVIHRNECMRDHAAGGMAGGRQAQAWRCCGCPPGSILTASALSLICSQTCVHCCAGS